MRIIEVGSHKQVFKPRKRTEVDCLICGLIAKDANALAKAKCVSRDSKEFNPRLEPK